MVTVFWLGVLFWGQDASGSALCIRAVAQGSPAATAGLELGSCIVGANHSAVFHEDDLNRELQRAGTAGAPLDLELRRADGASVLATVRPTPRPPGAVEQLCDVAALEGRAIRVVSADGRTVRLRLRAKDASLDRAVREVSAPDDAWVGVFDAIGSCGRGPHTLAQQGRVRDLAGLRLLDGTVVRIDDPLMVPDDTDGVPPLSAEAEAAQLFLSAYVERDLAPDSARRKLFRVLHLVGPESDVHGKASRLLSELAGRAGP